MASRHSEECGGSSAAPEPPATIQMMNRRWVHATLFSREYVAGVKSFMEFVRERFAEGAKILCPCSRCLNQKDLDQDHVEKHILLYGMSSTYTRWIHHGEDNEVHVLEEPVQGNAGDSNNCDDRFEDILHDLYRSEEPDANEGSHEHTNQDEHPPHGNESVFAAMMDEAKRELYPGCPKFSRFSFVVKMLHMKSYYRISNSAFSAFLNLLSETFPEFNSLPKSYEEAKKMLRQLGLGYISIHVCPNNCVLFRKRFEKNDNCPVCGASRWKDPERKKVPNKVLRHFPLIPRLQRIFVNRRTSKNARWHKSKRKPDEKEMCHPADGDAWKDFDRRWPDFAADARNLRLGLATDGFNPFGNMSSSYSMWPVFVIPYNLPPWCCMDESNFMMALLIPGPESPSKDFDVFLQPLVEDLLELWAGVHTKDVLTGKKFYLRAAVLWCIHDYPALSTLSGRTTKGYFACIHCDKNPLSYLLRNKICYIGHCRFLPRGHRLWRDNEFACLHGSKDKPGSFTTEELLGELEKVRDVRPGQKRKRSEKIVPIWGQRVSLWDLPYWQHLKLRHNLDVMHIEKNVCDNLLGTILDISGKTKDTINARLDLADLNIRRELHLKDNGNSYDMPAARYTLPKSQKIAFYQFLSEVKFPDGYASNIARCINADRTKVHGLKTHDCHILLQRIMPAGIRGFLDEDIYAAICELGKFFRELCSKKLNRDVLDRMKEEIPIILCKLEKIFPPAFFDVMVHLTVHLPEEAMLRGPVQFGWMYPIERRLLTLKRNVRNKARPEGSIAEAYVAEECLTFCSRYMDDVETRFNRAPRNSGFSDESVFGVDVFGHGVNLIGACQLVYYEEFDQLVFYVLNNCAQVEDYSKKFKFQLERDGVPEAEIGRRFRQGFVTWFRNHISINETDEVDDDLFALACGPDLRVRVYSTCIVNGVRYSTVEREKNRKSQNSGLTCEGTHNNKDIDFYGTLKEILELQYNCKEDGTPRSVVLFKCDWYKLDGKRTSLKDDGFFKSINTGNFWYKNDCFILATQARQVFYLPDNKFGKNWKVVQQFGHRHLFNVSEIDGVLPNAAPYQEEDYIEVDGGQPEVSEVMPNIPLNRNDKEEHIVDAAEVERLIKENESWSYNVHEDEEDDTILEYCNEHECPTEEVDSDDE